MALRKRWRARKAISCPSLTRDVSSQELGLTHPAPEAQSRLRTELLRGRHHGACLGNGEQLRVSSGGNRKLGEPSSRQD